MILAPLPIENVVEIDLAVNVYSFFFKKMHSLRNTDNRPKYSERLGFLIIFPLCLMTE